MSPYAFKRFKQARAVLVLAIVVNAMASTGMVYLALTSEAYGSYLSLAVLFVVLSFINGYLLGRLYRSINQ
jgi:hypothetical protein